jgi:hypothetical protein
MASQWLITTPYNSETLSTTTTATTISQTQTRSLPRANFLARIGGTIRVVGVGTPTLTFDRIRILLNGSQAVLDVRGGLLRAIQRYENGSAKNGTLTSTTDLALPFQYQFGRFIRDTQVILPAKLFKSVDLQLSYTYGAGTSVSLVALDLWSEELIADDDPTKKLMKRIVTIDARDPAASALVSVDLNLGGFLRAIYLWIADLDNIGANGSANGGTNGTTNLVRLIGNGSDIPYAQAAGTIDAMMVNTYRQDDAAVPTGTASDAAVATGTQVVYKIDFDLDDSLSRVIDTNRLNRLQLEYTVAASGDSGNVEVTQEDIVPVVA